MNRRNVIRIILSVFAAAVIIGTIIAAISVAGKGRENTEAVSDNILQGSIV